MIYVGVPKEYKSFIFKKLRPIAQKEKMDLWNTAHGLKLFSKDYPNVGTDIFLYIQNDGYWILSNEQDRMAWPKDKFKFEEIEKIARGKFGELEVNLPENPYRYLFELYGEDCLTMGQRSWDHLNNRPYPNQTKVPLTKIILVD